MNWILEAVAGGVIGTLIGYALIIAFVVLTHLGDLRADWRARRR